MLTTPEFENVQNNVRDRLKEVSKLYTEPSHDPDQPPTHRYTLRGVRTTSHTVYVLEKARPEDENDMLLPAADDWQWWKLDYDTTSVSPIQTTKVEEIEVLQAASFDSRNALLVYASDRALSYDHAPLPTQLHNFVRTDNLAFQSEIDNYNAQNAISTFDTSPSPQKRKADGDSDLEVEFDRSPRARSNDGGVDDSSGSSP